jgi:hypothetical protein
MLIPVCAVVSVCSEWSQSSKASVRCRRGAMVGGGGWVGFRWEEG